MQATHMMGITAKKNNIILTKRTVVIIAKTEFTNNNYKDRDHCHIAGKYRGAAHNKCNIKIL